MTDVDRFIQFCESDFGNAVMNREAAYVQEQVASDDLLLDVGCGIGSLEERLASQDMIGLDLSLDMVKAASDRASAPFICGDARRLPIPSGVIDAVVFIATLEFIPDVETVLAEAVRVLDDDGTLITLILNTQSEYVQSHLDREGSYFQEMVHRNTGELTSTVFEYVDGTQEYMLGIKDEEIIERTDLSTAAIAAIAGTPLNENR